MRKFIERSSPALLKERELILAVFEAVAWRSFPFGKAGMGLLPHWSQRGENESAALTVEPHIIKHFKEILLAD